MSALPCRPCRPLPQQRQETQPDSLNAPLRALSSTLSLVLSLVLLLVLLPAAGLAQAQLAGVPPLKAHVNDYAGMLDAQQRARLDAVLADYEQKTGSQIAVLLLTSTAPETIEQYSIRVADAWKLGRKGVDDGVLLLVARDNPAGLRRLRIEAGRGVQGVLTDAQSGRILQDVIAPHFRQNDYYGGLVAGVGAIAALLNQESFPGAGAGAHQNEGGSWLLFVLFAALLLASLVRRTARLGQGGWASGASGFIIGSALGRLGGGAGSPGGGYSGGGGSFDGGGASGNW